MKFKDLLEIKIKKMNLPSSIENYKLNWNDKFQHNFYDRIKVRTNLSRKKIVKLITTALENNNLSYGPHILKFTVSEFYVSVFVEDDAINIKTILSYDMKIRKNDRVFKINEVENLFNFDLSEFYIDGPVNSYHGSFLIEESIDRKSLEVFPDYIEVEK
jgi:hypothetical protein